MKSFVIRNLLFERGGLLSVAKKELCMRKMCARVRDHRRSGMGPATIQLGGGDPSLFVEDSIPISVKKVPKKVVILKIRRSLPPTSVKQLKRQNSSEKWAKSREVEFLTRCQLFHLFLRGWGQQRERIY